MKLPFADEVNYWKTGSSSPDTWMAKAVALLKQLGATGITQGFGSRDGAGAYVICFNVAGESFRVAWPILPVRRPKNEQAARIQAATFVYHEVKASALAASVRGVRTAFIGNLLLPSGATVAEASHRIRGLRQDADERRRPPEPLFEGTK